MKIIKTIFGVCTAFVIFTQAQSMDLLQDKMQKAQEAFFQLSSESKKTPVTPKVIVPLYMDTVKKLSEVIGELATIIPKLSHESPGDGYDESDDSCSTLGLNCYSFLDSFWELSREGALGQIIASKFGDEVSDCFKEHERFKVAHA